MFNKLSERIKRELGYRDFDDSLNKYKQARDALGAIAASHLALRTYSTTTPCAEPFTNVVDITPRLDPRVNDCMAEYYLNTVRKQTSHVTIIRLQ